MNVIRRWAMKRKLRKFTALLLAAIMCAGIPYHSVFASDIEAPSETESTDTGQKGPTEDVTDTGQEQVTDQEQPEANPQSIADEDTTISDDSGTDASGETKEVFAASSDTPTIFTEEETYINPLYKNEVTEEDLNTSSSNNAAEVAISDAYYASVENAGVAMRSGLKEREATIQIQYQSTDSYDSSITRDIVDTALSHTGNPTEGDYLMWQYAGWRANISYYSSDAVYYYTITYTLTYYTTAGQEEEMDTAVTNVMNQLNVTDKDDFAKIQSIYDYICNNVTYDYTNLNDSDYKLKYTAYAALINGTSVCQGYAVLLYRLALEYGIDARVISGTGNGEGHGWNIVKLGGKYYNADATWDAGRKEYRYFLLCDENFTDHLRDTEYTTDLFYVSYPMSETDYEADTETMHPLTIDIQPKDYIGKSGSMAEFTVEASGDGLRYQWQLSDDGKNWRNSNTKGTVYNAVLSSSNNGRKVRCVVTDTYGNSLTTDAASMILYELQIMQQPTDYVGKLGNMAEFTMAASGTGLTYQWQLSDDGINWRNSSTKGTVYHAVLTNVNNGRRVRCLVTDTYGNSITTDPASIIVYELKITRQPEDYIGESGSMAEFTVEASGNGLKYQWQLSDDGENWRNSSTKGTVYNVILSSANSGRKVRCIVTDAYGNSLTTDAVSMVLYELQITEQPVDYVGELGSMAEFTAKALGHGLTYQWQLSDDGINWRNSSTKGTVYNAVLTNVNNGRQVRCMVTDAYGNSVITNPASIIVYELKITKQPEDYIGESGSMAEFTVKASGDGLKYQWQLSDDGENWRNSSTKASTYNVILTSLNNGRQVRCVIADAYGNRVTTDAASMLLYELKLTEQPEDYIGESGSMAEFTVAASGSGLKYQWQLSDDGENWRNSSTKGTVYKAVLTNVNHGRQVRCVVTDSYGNRMISNSASMFLYELEITKQPEDYAGDKGDRTIFSVSAKGYELSYQWEVSADDGTTWNKTSSTMEALSVVLDDETNGNLYRCVITDRFAKTIISNSVRLEITGIILNSHPEDYSGLAGDSVVFIVTASGNNLSYQWQLSDDNGAT